jgi:hypothetical protein
MTENELETEIARLREALKTITGLVSVGADKGAVLAECRAALFDAPCRTETEGRFFDPQKGPP